MGEHEYVERQQSLQSVCGICRCVWNETVICSTLFSRHADMHGICHYVAIMPHRARSRLAALVHPRLNALLKPKSPMSFFFISSRSDSQHLVRST